ncbi:MAG: hypothetical protein ACAF42_16110 [Limnothrix sp. BL-A-16]|jgi:hypothetical protein
MSTEPSLQGIAEKLDALSDELTKANVRLEETNMRLDRSDERFEVYQKATQWVVQLAFGLIASATVTILITSIVRR